MFTFRVAAIYYNIIQYLDKNENRLQQNKLRILPNLI